jgi:hypothetical protein
VTFSLVRAIGPPHPLDGPQNDLAISGGAAAALHVKLARNYGRGFVHWIAGLGGAAESPYRLAIQRASRIRASPSPVM